MKYLLLLPLLLAAGCSSITGTRTAPDGTTLTMTCNRFLWVSQKIEFSTKDSKGFDVSLKVGESRTDVEAINALAALAGKSAAAAATP